jgi:hypothetical protein
MLIYVKQDFIALKEALVLDLNNVNQVNNAQLVPLNLQHVQMERTKIILNSHSAMIAHQVIIALVLFQVSVQLSQLFAQLAVIVQAKLRLIKGNHAILVSTSLSKVVLNVLHAHQDITVVLNLQLVLCHLLNLVIKDTIV